MVLPQTNKQKTRKKKEKMADFRRLYIHILAKKRIVAHQVLVFMLIVIILALSFLSRGSNL